MASRRGRSSVDPHRDREHVSNTNFEGTYVGMSLFTYEEPDKRSQTRARVWFNKPARQRRE